MTSPAALAGWRSTSRVGLSDAVHGTLVYQLPAPSGGSAPPPLRYQLIIRIVLDAWSPPQPAGTLGLVHATGLPGRSVACTRRQGSPVPHPVPVSVADARSETRLGGVL